MKVKIFVFTKVINYDLQFNSFAKVICHEGILLKHLRHVLTNNVLAAGSRFETTNIIHKRLLYFVYQLNRIIVRLPSCGINNLDLRYNQILFIELCECVIFKYEEH